MVIASTLPPDSVVRVLKPIIQTGDYPTNEAAINMLTRLAEEASPDTTLNILPDIMPGLIQVSRQIPFLK